MIILRNRPGKMSIENRKHYAAFLTSVKKNGILIPSER